MPKFRFGLEKVLQHRKTVEDLAQRDFQEAFAILQEEIQTLEKMQAQRSLAFVQRHEVETKSLTSPGPLVQVQDYLVGQDLRIERQKKKIQEIEKQVEERREVLRQKALETKIMKGLKERKHEDFVREQKKVEQKLLDDMVTTRFARGDESDKNGI